MSTKRFEMIDRKSFTVTAKGKSIRKFNGKDSAATRDVICEYPNIEVRKEGGAGYVCQYRLTKTVAVRLAFGICMGSAVQNGLSLAKHNGVTPKNIKAKCNEVRANGRAADADKPYTSPVRTAMQALD